MDNGRILERRTGAGSPWRGDSIQPAAGPVVSHERKDHLQESVSYFPDRYCIIIPEAGISSKPIIGIPTTKGKNYAEAIEKAGGIPRLLPYDIGEIPKHIDELDGILFPGGADIPPELYGDEEVHPTVKPVAADRLNFEMELGKTWLKDTDKPFLGICLGCQMLNVVQGGTLVQDIPSEFGGNHRQDHAVSVEPGSKLHAIFNSENVEVNSTHHQAVRNLGKDLRIVAKAPDGIVEAIEMTSDRFVVGVQWHPERLKDDEKQQKIFSAFVKEAARKKASARP